MFCRRAVKQAELMTWVWIGVGIVTLSFVLFSALKIAELAAAPAEQDSACTKHVLSTMDELSTLVAKGTGSDRISQFLKGSLDNYHCDSLDLTKIVRRPEITLASFEEHTIIINGKLPTAAYFTFHLGALTSTFGEPRFHYEGPI